MKGLLELIKLIFGPKALSKTIGTRTNVIRLPNNKIKRYTKQDLDIESASDAAAMNAKKEMEELIAEIPKMNDAERLIFEGNLRRLKNRLGIRSEKDPTADVYEFGTKLKATPKGIETLTEQAGQKSPPGTVMGNLESRLNRLRSSGKDLGDIAKEEGGVKFSIPEEGIFNQELSADNLFDTIIKQQERFRKIQDSGLVTSTAREILQRDIKAGKLKLPKEIEDRIMLVDGNPGTVNPVEVFRTNYGEDALEQIDSLIPELAKAQSFSDLVKIVEKKYPMKPLAKPRKETMSLDEATKAEQENILTPGKAISADSPEGKKITEALIGKPKAGIVSLPTAEKILSDMRKLGPIDAMKEANKVLKREGPYKNLTDKDIEKIMDDINDHIFGGDLPVDPEDFANGGRVGFMDGGSKGLDYLTGMDRKGYADGTEAPVYKILADGSLGPRIITDSMVKNFFGDSPFDGEDLKKAFGEYITFMSDEGYQKEKALNQQLEKYKVQGENPDGSWYTKYNIPSSTADQTPTEDTSSEPAITALPQAQEQAQVVKDLSTSINPLDRFQSHVDFNEELKNKVKSGELSREDYNIMGGYDVVQKVLGPDFAIKNPMLTKLGMAGASGIYNAIQALKGEQDWSEIPGTVSRNVQGAMNIISPKMRNQYNEFIQKTQQASPTVAQNINTAVSNLNPFQQQKYMQYATENPEKAREAAQRNQDFIQAIQRGNQATGGRVGYMGGGSKGLDYLMGIERRGYAEGTDPTTEALKLLLLPLNNGGGSEANAGGIGLSGNLDPDTKQMTQIETWDPIEGWTPSVVETYSNLSSGLRQTLEGLNAQPGFSNTGPPPGIAGALMGMLGIGRTVNGFVPGSIRGRWDSFSDMFGGNKATDSIDWDAVDRDQAGDTGGDFGGFDSAAEDSDQSGGDAGSTSGADPAGDGGDGYATGGLVNRTKNSQGGLNYLMGY